jgi:hypothetical protein
MLHDPSFVVYFAGYNFFSGNPYCIMPNPLRISRLVLEGDKLSRSCFVCLLKLLISSFVSLRFAILSSQQMTLSRLCHHCKLKAVTWFKKNQFRLVFQLLKCFFLLKPYLTGRTVFQIFVLIIFQNPAF